jgi:hypothetical protein
MSFSFFVQGIHLFTLRVNAKYGEKAGQVSFGIYSVGFTTETYRNRRGKMPSCGIDVPLAASASPMVSAVFQFIKGIEWVLNAELAACFESGLYPECSFRRVLAASSETVDGPASAMAW